MWYIIDVVNYTSPAEADEVYLAVGKKRKTREQKIISALRRRISLQSLEQNPQISQSELLPKRSNIHNNEPFAVKSPISITLNRIPSSVKVKPLSIHIQGDYSFLAKDLQKIAILTGLAFFAQGVLYLALR